MSNAPWTPTVAGTVHAGTTTYEAQSGTYNPGINWNNISLTVEFNGAALASSATGNLVINGLPVTENSDFSQGQTMNYYVNGTLVGQVGVNIAIGSSQVQILESNGSPMPVSALSGTVTITGGFLAFAS